MSWLVHGNIQLIEHNTFFKILKICQQKKNIYFICNRAGINFLEFYVTLSILRWMLVPVTWKKEEISWPRYSKSELFHKNFTFEVVRRGFTAYPMFVWCLKECKYLTLHLNGPFLRTLYCRSPKASLTVSSHNYKRLCSARIFL